ncbi:MAG: hypothetical protein K2W96_22035 [Gemmataceae bacterium]|nr:hypothetical protein [Gemmataceae bacterium]
MEAKDRVRDILVEALAAAIAGGEARLWKAGKLDGLFPSRTGASAEAARRALDEGLLERVRVETKGKTEIEWVRLTPRGVQWLHDHESPVRALHELRDAVRQGRRAMPLWLDEMGGVLDAVRLQLKEDAERWESRLEALERRVVDTLRRLEASGPLVPPELAREHPWCIDALNYLDRRRTAGAPEACPLPELFAAVAEHHPALSILAFHEGLKTLHHRKAVLLRAPSGEMPSAEFALLDGAEVYYFAVR